jgi:sugar phosphate isomerase/epimerase
VSSAGEPVTAAVCRSPGPTLDAVSLPSPPPPAGWRLTDADWNSWPDGLSDAQTWEQALDLGLEGIELGVYDAAAELAPARLVELARLVERTGVPVTAVLLSLPAERWPDGALSGDVDRLVVQVAACARACSSLGIAELGLWPGADPVGADVTTGLQKAVLAARGLPLALEYKPGTAVGDAAEALALCEQVPGVGVLLDTGHAHAAGEDPARVVELLGGRLLHCHLGDAEQGESDDDLPCGRVHDFSAFVTALDEAGFSGSASFDLYGAVSSGLLTGEQAVRESRDHILSRRR